MRRQTGAQYQVTFQQAEDTGLGEVRGMWKQRTLTGSEKENILITSQQILDSRMFRIAPARAELGGRGLFVLLPPTSLEIFHHQSSGPSPCEVESVSDVSYLAI